MSPHARSSSRETEPLLPAAHHLSRAASYKSFSSTVTCNTDDSSDFDGSTLGDSDSDNDPSPLNNLSHTDLCLVLAGLWSAVFLGALDGTIVATLLTPIGSHFGKSNQASYLGTAYLLSVCCFTPLYGRLSDILGRKGAMLLGLALFGTGTIYCGMAQSMETLIVARAVAGMGGGGVMTVSSVTVTDLIPLKQRGLYQGMANILFGLGAGIGGPLGGWINDTLGWRYAFLLQLPVLAFSVILVIWKVNIKLPGEVENQKLSLKLKKIDFLGSFTLVGTVGSLLLAISLKSSEELPWSHPVVYGLLITSAVSGVLFFLSEKYWAPFPVMPLRLMTKRTPLAVSLNNLVTSMAAFSMLYNIPLYFEAVRLSSAANAGLHLLPHSIAISSGSVFAGWMMRRTGKLYNLSLTSAALTVLASTLVFFWNEGTTTLHLWLDIVPQGFGMSSLITTTLIAMIAGVRKEDMAVATGITYLFRTTGQVLGVSLSGALLQSILLQKLRSRFSDPNLISQIRHSADFVKELNPHDRQLAVDSYADALRVIFICQMALNFLGFLTCLPIQENDLPGTKQEEQAHYDRVERRQTNQVSNEGLNA